MPVFAISPIRSQVTKSSSTEYLRGTLSVTSPATVGREVRKRASREVFYEWQRICCTLSVEAPYRSPETRIVWLTDSSYPHLVMCLRRQVAYRIYRLTRYLYRSPLYRVGSLVLEHPFRLTTTRSPIHFHSRSGGIVGVVEYNTIGLQTSRNKVYIKIVDAVPTLMCRVCNRLSECYVMITSRCRRQRQREVLRSFDSDGQHRREVVDGNERTRIVRI